MTAGGTVSVRFSKFVPNGDTLNEEEAAVSYLIGGVEREVDADGYLLEPELSDEAVHVIARAEGITLTDAHWQVVNYLRERFKEDGHTPNFRNMLKDLQEIMPGVDSKAVYDLFPMGPAKQGAKVAGLPQPYGKGGY